MNFKSLPQLLDFFKDEQTFPSVGVFHQLGLILTSDLFTVCQYLNKKKDSKFQIKCREAIRKGLGSKIDFPETPKTDS
ncbi:MAG: hypothetical protein CMP48_22045 [Rickettsiales bacterium]|nr:hypothetical protein [Rickettsiales bacterium]